MINVINKTIAIILTSQIPLDSRVKTKEELINNPKPLRPHVVLLGAGASRAALPNGDANGKILPLMNDLIEILDLNVPVTHLDDQINFEIVYPNLSTTDQDEIYDRIYNHFSEFKLPQTTTIYDQLLLSLRAKDSIITFNWDPLLFDAYERNKNVAPLPSIYFLHGNVRLGWCNKDSCFGLKNSECSKCGINFCEIPLLMGMKNYTTNPCIEWMWERAKKVLSESFTLTIFGYGAPSSDAEAMKLLRDAWQYYMGRELGYLEVIDTVDSDVVYERWGMFSPKRNYLHRTEFKESTLYEFPRRSCEALLAKISNANICEPFCLPFDPDLKNFQDGVRNLTKFE